MEGPPLAGMHHDGGGHSALHRARHRTPRPAAHVQARQWCDLAARSLTVFYQKRRNSPTDYKILFLTLFFLWRSPEAPSLDSRLRVVGVVAGGAVCSEARKEHGGNGWRDAEPLGGRLAARRAAVERSGTGVAGLPPPAWPCGVCGGL